MNAQHPVDPTQSHPAGHGPELSRFDWADPFLLNAQLTEEERMLAEAAETFSQNALAPLVTDSYRDESFDRSLFEKWAARAFLV